MGRRESDFQAKLIKDIEQQFPGSIVTKLDSSHIQGIPDLLILYRDKWATLECKKSEKIIETINDQTKIFTLTE